MFRFYSRNRRRQMIGSRPSHDSLQQAILQTLNTLPDTFVWTMETGGKPVRGANGWNFRKNPWGRGKPDLAGCKAGKSFCLEVKFGKDQLSPEQEDWLTDYVERGKGKAKVVRSVDDAVEFWNTI